MKKVFGQIGRLKPECIELYRRLHEQDVYLVDGCLHVSELRDACDSVRYLHQLGG